MVEGITPAFLMTVQEQSLALTGPSAAQWPVELEPLAIESAGGDPVESGESGCYPGWEFLRAGWTAEGRTFEARVGFAPDATDEDRKAVTTAFESMTFAPPSEASQSAVLATGTAGGEDWQVIASREADGLVLSLQGTTFGAGTSVLDPAHRELQLLDHVFGGGAGSERVVFAAVPAGVVRIVGIDAATGPVEIGVLDVSDDIDERLNAFVLTMPSDRIMTFEAYDADGRLVARGEPLRPVGPTTEIDIVWTRLFRARSTAAFYAAGHGGSFVGFDAAAARRIDPGVGGDPGLRWNGGALRDGEVSIRGATADSLVLVSATSLGDTYCIAVTADPYGAVSTRYGTQDATSAEGCGGGW
jgi:hypothetical protein